MILRHSTIKHNTCNDVWNLLFLGTTDSSKKPTQQKNVEKETAEVLDIKVLLNSSPLLIVLYGAINDVRDDDVMLFVIDYF